MIWPAWGNLSDSPGFPCTPSALHTGSTHWHTCRPLFLHREHPWSWKDAGWPGNLLIFNPQHLASAWHNLSALEISTRWIKKSQNCVCESTGWVLVHPSATNRTGAGRSCDSSLARVPFPSTHEALFRAAGNLFLLLAYPVFFLDLHSCPKRWDNCTVSFLRGQCYIIKQDKTKAKP